MEEDSMSRAFIVAAATAALLYGAVAPAATARHLTGTVGPGYTIAMGAKSVKAGAYTITVRDRSGIHNFHLVGPGVNKKTAVAAVKTYSWKVTLKRGTYRFTCDVHTSVMHGVLRVS
jgi:plastocyanin